MPKFKNKRYLCWIPLFIFSCFSKGTKIGNEAPELAPMRWWNREIPSLHSLKSKVVFIRWWTDQCQFCEASADALNEWHQELADSGLVVLGVYHPKPAPRILEDNEVYDYIREKNFTFPIAEDAQWTNLTKYRTENELSEFTSVSFLLDKKGIIRYIHPGGEYHKEYKDGHDECVRQFHVIDSLIRVLLKEK
ncbi:MAG: TlpA family protein disulfide reductase [Saprospiraceae bacterium]|nr:TlpA family protein disulfide reductase [Saprospiraceae bacterium]MBK9630081.1 TlpA family protein disulfide reductase [Saprospiraceae bacterium]